MNALVPLFVKNLMKSVRSEQQQFVKVLNENFIMPSKINILHYFAFYNNPEGLT
jgi:hypothetical protein